MNAAKNSTFKSLPGWAWLTRDVDGERFAR